MTDSHCHIAGKEFAGDLDAVVERARAAGVQRALVILAAEDDEEFARVPAVLAAWPECRFAIGVHPHHAHVYAADPGAVAAAVAARLDALPEARAVGEIGLDYHYDFSPRDVQQAVFREQIRLAHELRLPFAIHTREAEDDTFRIMNEERAGEVGGVFHCFSGSEDLARRALEVGFMISFSGIVTFKKADELRNIARLVPLDRLLIETDCPYLTPVPCRGKRNEPAYVVEVARCLAGLHGLEIEQLAHVTTENFMRFFSLQ